MICFSMTFTIHCTWALLGILNPMSQLVRPMFVLWSTKVLAKRLLKYSLFFQLQNSYLNRLKGIRATLETSPFFKCHEVKMSTFLWSLMSVSLPEQVVDASDFYLDNHEELTKVPLCNTSNTDIFITCSTVMELLVLGDPVDTFLEVCGGLASGSRDSF